MPKMRFGFALCRPEKRRVFTIDPDDVRRTSTTLSLFEPFGDGRLLLGVHIADVSHYVPWGHP